MSKDNYRIFWVDKDYKGTKFQGDRVTAETFYADSNDAAYEHLLEFKKEHTDREYYYDCINIYEYVDSKGVKHESMSIFDDWHVRDKDRPLHVRIWDKVSLEFTYWLWDVPKRGWYWLRDLAYLVKTRHNYNESWNLDCHILDDLLWNIPILIKYRNGISIDYLDEARKQIHADEANFDLDAYNREHYNYTDEEEKLAVEIQNKSYRTLLRHIKAYNYYRHDGWLDDDTESKALDAELHSTLPIIPGTYDTMDYKKLDKLALAEWNAIWAWMAKHGEGLWD